MNFITAIKEIKDGKRVRRQSWGDQEAHFKLHNGQLCVKEKDGYHPVMISEADIYGQDWEVTFDA